jgi:hypothetical protein
MESNNGWIESNDNDQWINIRALRWALKQQCDTVAMKGTLMMFAIHSDPRGYSFPWAATRNAFPRATTDCFAVARSSSGAATLPSHHSTKGEATSPNTSVS